MINIQYLTLYNQKIREFQNQVLELNINYINNCIESFDSKIDLKIKEIESFDKDVKIKSDQLKKSVFNKQLNELKSGFEKINRLIREKNELPQTIICPDPLELDQNIKIFSSEATRKPQHQPINYKSKNKNRFFNKEPTHTIINNNNHSV